MVNGTVSISIEDFDELRSDAKAYRTLLKSIQGCMEVKFDDETEKTLLIVDKDKVELILKVYNPEDEVYEENIDEVEWK